MDKLQRIYSKIDPLLIVEEIVESKAEFKNLLNQPNPPENEIIILIVKITQKVADCRLSANLVLQILDDVYQSLFLKLHLPHYFSALLSEPDIHQRWAEATGIIFSLCSIFQVLLQRFPSSAPDLLIVLNICQAFCGIAGCEEDSSLLLEIKQQQDNCNEMFTVTRNLKRAARASSNIVDEGTPPDDFRDIPIHPTESDIHLEEQPFIRPNKTTGAYNDLDHYLDVQFRLMREDFIRPLRDGILQHRQMLGQRKKERNFDIRVYESVRIIQPVPKETGMCYRLRFSVERLKNVRWEESKRLIFGSLVCLSTDNFHTFFLASVTDRDPKTIGKGIIDVRFEGEKRAINHNDVFTMAESSAFFEASRHVLLGLQRITRNFPFQRYIVHGETDVESPAYLRNNQGYSLSALFSYDEMQPISTLNRLRFRSCQVMDLDSWPDANAMGLDEPQHQALKMALTNELAMIQGPPGTGKTFIGLKIMKVRLRRQIFSKG